MPAWPSFVRRFILLIGWIALVRAYADPARIDFNRQIRPLLADTCFRCHGFDAGARKAGLRLDVRDAAVLPAKSGTVPIVPGNPDKSEVIRRISSTDTDTVMPPPELHRPWTEDQRKLLRQWILEGAEYQGHWAFLPPERRSPPAMENGRAHPIDRFILEGLKARRLEPSPEADRSTLIRRLSLDLTGLPPTPVELDAFVPDLSPGAWERLIERLLGSPRFGERMAQDWLDAARFADSNGYQVDRDREMWAWRDWVVSAFNRNVPFDQFTLEQFAGDLLPSPTLEQRIATGFHRNHMINEEGGIIGEEFLNEYCADRVETTATVWLGLTFNCARCHDHKYDPITQRDFYGLYAFFNGVTEKGVGDYGAHYRRSSPPFLKLPAPEREARVQQLRRNRESAVWVVDQLTSDWEKKTASDEGNSKTLEIRKILATPAANRTEPERKQLDEARKAGIPELAALTQRLSDLQKQINEAENQLPVTLVMEEMAQPRPTFVLARGAYDKPGDKVEARTPASLPAFPDSLPRNRLGLARWLVDPSNPLTARVTVNRLWQQLFGTGLVRTAEDFGTQGEPPSHPELLDWLATEFIRSGWDIKAMLRLMATSHAYRQDSRSSAAGRAADPENRWLARGPRHRLSAEIIRDQALATAGLLVGDLGGPSVKPYHPPGLYEQVVAGSSADTYVMDHGASLYRRTLYTYWKRSVPNPALLLFDRPFRETCAVRRSRTSTPLQALNLLNDATYVEAARGLAQRMIREGGRVPESRIRHGFRLVMCREPRARELTVLTAGFSRSLAQFREHPKATADWLAVGESKPDPGLDPLELAAYATVGSTLLNLDETLNRE